MRFVTKTLSVIYTDKFPLSAIKYWCHIKAMIATIIKYYQISLHLCVSESLKKKETGKKIHDHHSAYNIPLLFLHVEGS